MSYDSYFDEKWECFLYENRMVGLKSLEDHTHNVDLQLILTVGSLAPITLAHRSREYSHHFFRHHQFGKPFQDFPDQNQQAGIVKEGQDGETAPNIIVYEGSISEAYTALDSEIIYMDLRTDLVVMKQREVKVSFDGTGNAPPGELTIYFDALNDEMNVKKQYDPGDVVLMPLTAHRDTTEKYIIASPKKFVAEPSLFPTSETYRGELVVGVSDKSGFHHLDLTNPSGTQYVWQSYGVMDIRFPIEQAADGTWMFVEYTKTPYDTYPTDNEYRPYWNNVGLAAVDDVLAAAWNEFYEVHGTARVPTILPVSAWPFTPGSFAFDTAGDYFGHLKFTDTGGTPRTYTKMATATGTAVDPSTVFNLGSEAAYYPISPAA